MNNDPTIAEQQQVIAAAAASYTPPEPQSHTMLMPHRESIAMLRSKGASFRTIVKILGKVNIRVSLDTLSRFCRESIEQKPERKVRRRPRAASVAARTETFPSGVQPKAPAPDREENTNIQSRGKGPRIADPGSI
ncbi:MAG: hypothetical protein QM680_10610 [Luteolibacter sp.]